METVGTFCHYAEQRDSIDPIPPIRTLRSVDSAIRSKRKLAEQVASGMSVVVHLCLAGDRKLGERGRQCRRYVGVVGVEERGDAGEAEDAGSGIDEVEVGEMTVCSLCDNVESVRGPG
jgi:hypothetical protein